MESVSRSSMDVKPEVTDAKDICNRFLYRNESKEETCVKEEISYRVELETHNTECGLNYDDDSIKLELLHEELDIKTETLETRRTMNPINDIVCSLLEKPFSDWKEEDKKDVLNQGRPTVGLTISAKKDLKGRRKSYNLKFKISWFTEFKWLCSSPILQKLFCWPCLLFCTKQFVWNREGFADLLNITRALHKHVDSKDHLICALKLKNFEKNQNTIGDALKENARLIKAQFNENVRLNRLFLQTVIDTVLYLSKQELAFHGHDESSDSANRGNFKELLALLISRSPIEIKTHYGKIKNVFTGDSKIIQNELIHCISNYIDDYVKDEINKADFFSIQVDDATDITQASQCSLIIRFVDSGGKVVERFLGFHNVSADRSSAALYDVLVNILQQFDFEQKLIGQCYDGASVMSGHLNGLQQKIKDRVPQAIFVHCLAHRLNLVLQQSLKKISQCRIFFASLSGIPSFFHHSAKRTYTTITETRWSSNSKLVNVIVEDWNKLKEVFELIITSESSDKTSIQLARGFLNDFNNFEFTFLAVVFNDIFSLTDILFDVLQKKSLDINFCVTKINKTIELLKRKRNDDFFDTLFEKTKEIEITQIDISKRPKREYASLTNNDIRRKYRILFYEVLDHIVMEMEVRFQDCDKLQFMSLADTTKFEQYDSYFPSKAFESLGQFYGKIFTKSQRLKNELNLLYADESYRNLQTRELLENLNENKEIFTEAYKLFCLILTIPATSASAERSFSCLKRIKTYLRNAVSQDRHSSLANISIQKELLLELIKNQPFYEDIINDFAALEDRRIDLIYKN